ncbi:MAG TPA: acyltransferase [Povalibacter sp.]|uniref:acyltransferase family protein n=1 Tax=Povalibacter sp. TaxID=1962978 RepID=UPI002C3714B8|nr:acyltransferase [Povalibacter sp.]HMN42979.1 acyltransferase [Povalibacter sp.]
MQTSKSDAIRLPELDLLRFIAAFAVTLYHYVSSYVSATDLERSGLAGLSAMTRYGYLGVDLFFIISGFVILWSSLGRGPVQFVISRVSRLYPSFWVGMALTAICIALLSPLAPDVDTAPLDLRTLAANATMVPSIFDARLIDGVYWTLEIEIRFYALIFLLLALRQMSRVEWWLYAWLAIAIAARLFHLPWIVDYFVLDPYGPFFAAGCLFYVLMSRGFSIARLLSLLVAAGASMWVSVTQRSQFITPDALSAWVVPILVATFFAAFAFIAIHRRDSTTGASPIASQLGALTYPLYLVHAIVGKLVYEALAPVLGVPARLTLICVLALGVAYVIAVTVDVPGRRALQRLLQQLVHRIGLAQPTSKANSPT